MEGHAAHPSLGGLMDINQEYELVDLMFDKDPLKEHPQNPNVGDTEIIDESINVNGWYGAVIAQRSTGYILKGNHSYRVAKNKGAKEIPVIWKDVDDETALKILLSDNETAKRSEYDEAKLEELLAGLETLEGTGFDKASRLEHDDNGASGDGDATTTPSISDLVDEHEIPDDKHKEEFAVIIMCASAQQQEETYRWFKQEWPDREIKLTST
jgi:ParB-like chromosome segregation protein Spo0J